MPVANENCGLCRLWLAALTIPVVAGSFAFSERARVPLRNPRTATFHLIRGNDTLVVEGVSPCPDASTDAPPQMSTVPFGRDSVVVEIRGVCSR